MQLNLKILGREMNDGMLEALRDFLVKHEHEGEYRISIEKMESDRQQSLPMTATATLPPPATIPTGSRRGRITATTRRQTQQAENVSFNLSEERKEVFSQNGKFTFKKRR